MNTNPDKSARPMKPCDRECPKCGSREIQMQHLFPGEQVNYTGIRAMRTDNRNIEYDRGTFAMRATTEHIHCHCRTCQYSFSQPVLIPKQSIAEIIKGH